MPLFIVKGRSQKSGRVVKLPEYRARDSDAAGKKATQAGINPDRIELVDVWHVVTHVASTSHKNPDNTSRQLIVRKCRPTEKVILEHEQGNRHDKHAVRVLRENGEQIGYLPQDVAKTVIDDFCFAEMCRYSAAVVSVEPFAPDSSVLTARLSVFVAMPTADKAKLAAIIDAKLRETGAGLSPSRMLPNAVLESRQRPNYSRQRSAGRGSITTTPKGQSGCLGVACWVGCALGAIAAFALFGC